MKRNLQILLFFIVLLLVAPEFGKSAQAATLKFDKNTITGKVNDEFSVDIIVNVGTETISGVDAYILYDPSLFDVINKDDKKTFFTRGSFFDGTSVSLMNGKIYVAGFVEDPGDSKTGTGTIASLKFKMLKNGSGSIAYDCRKDVLATSKIYKNDVNATDIIECEANGKTDITVGTATTQQVAPTTTPTPTPTPSVRAAAAPTATPTPTPTATPSPTPKPPTQLPQSGVFDNVVKYSVPGVVLLFLGGVVRLLL